VSLLSITGFTNLGYKLHARDFEPIDADLTGQTIVITGGTGGLGRAAAIELSRLGARLIVVSRTRSKLEDLRDSVDGPMDTIQADLGLMAEVREVADRLKSEQRIDVLINNVGVLLPERQETDEGIEKTLAVDLAGHFLLTNLLIPKLVESAPSRVINVTSGGMYSERIRPDDLQFEEGTYTGTAAYARAKRGQVILTEMWAERLEGTGVTVHSMHPGWARTEGVADSLPTFNLLMKPFLRTPEQGADTIVWLAAADEPGVTSGRFWFDREEAPTHMLESTQETESERHALWDGLADLTGADFPSPIVERTG
jgi:dehydrogenase/reductase SDR family protein 12